MTTPAQLSEQILALPSGPGAVRPAGETFLASPQSGAGTLRVPIEVPPGHAGLAPALALAYSTYGGVGAAGVGWRLDLGEVTRRTDHGLPTYRDDEDAFVLQGEELVAIGGGLYRRRVERGFARIRRIPATGGEAWLVEERDGSCVAYGMEPDHRLHDGAHRIAAWYPSMRRDANGNTVWYSYIRDVTTHDVRLARVEWAGCHCIELIWELRPDPVRSARTRFVHVAAHRLVRIDIRVRRSSDASWFTYRRMELSYRVSTVTGRSLLAAVRTVGIAPDGEEGALPLLRLAYADAASAPRWRSVGGSLPSRSLAHRGVTLVRQSGSGLPDLLESTTTGWWLRENVGDARFASPRRVPGPGLAGLEAPGTFLSDVDGDGWADLVVGGGRHVYPGRPGGGWGPPLPAAAAPGLDLDAPEVRLVDLTGDGCPDILRSGPGGWSFLANLGSGRWGRPRAVSEPPPVRLDDPRVHLADLSGDGLPDLVWVGDRDLTVWPGRGEGRFDRPISMRITGLSGPTFDPRRVRFVDLTGSGQADLLYEGSGEVAICRNLAGRTFAAPIRVPVDRATGDSHVEPVDLLGTGAMGLLFSQVPVHEGWRFAEIFPDGAPDLLTRVDSGLGARTDVRLTGSGEHWARDRARGVRWKGALPLVQRVVDTVTTTDSVTGSRVAVSYRYRHGAWDPVERELRGFAQVDQLDREADPDDPGPVAQALVRRWYHTGTEIDLRSEYAPLPTGAVEHHVPGHPEALRSLRGELLREEIYALDGVSLPYRVSETGWRVVAVASGAGRRSFAALASVRRETVLERTSERRVRETRTTWDVERGPGYGLPVEVREHAFGRPGAGPAAHERQQAQDLVRVTRTRYVKQDRPFGGLEEPPAYLVDRATEVTRHGGTEEALLSRQLFFYDGTPFEGLGYPGSGTDPGVERGRLSCRLDLVWTPALLAEAQSAYPGGFAELSDRGGLLQLADGWYRHSQRARYDARGMPVGLRDARGGETTLEHDARWGLFPVRRVDPAGLPTIFERDELPHRVAAQVDANGNTTHNGWDPSGLPGWMAVSGKRVDGEWQGDPPTHPTEIYSYDTLSTPVRVTTRSRRERLGELAEHHRYVDGMGRTVQERRSAEPDPGTGAPRYRVSGWQEYNNKGLPVRAWQAYFSPSADFAPGATDTPSVRTTYDPLGRRVRVDHPDGTFSTESWQPWSRVVRDRNDNAGHLLPTDPRYGPRLHEWATHHDTPVVVYLDALGREFAHSQLSGAHPTMTRTVLDLDGRALELWDGRGLTSPTWRFTWTNTGDRLVADNPTASGRRVQMPDAGGATIWSRDARGVEVRRWFDALGRPLQETSDAGTGPRLRRAWTYAAYDPQDARFVSHQRDNLFGRPAETRDADGLRSYAYDWRGLVVRLTARFWAQPGWDDPGSPFWLEGADWDPAIAANDADDIAGWLTLPEVGSALDVTTRYDAAGRPVEVRHPAGLAVNTSWNPAGFLGRVEVVRLASGAADQTTLLAAAEYDALGRLTRRELANGVVTTRRFDPALDRLVRVDSASPSEQTLERRLYAYDPEGNPLAIEDHIASGSPADRVVPNSRSFGYSPYYRLERASGTALREVEPGADEVVEPAPTPSKYEPYEVHYTYDTAGNLTRNDEYGDDLRYKLGRIDLFDGRAEEASGDPATGAWRYDANGNTVATPRLPALAYSHDDQCRWVALRSGGDAVRYLRHDDERVLRFARRGNAVGLRVYLGDLELESREGVLRVLLRVPGLAQVQADGTSGPMRVIFHLDDPLGSAHVLTGADGAVLDQEEHFPYGRASDRRASFNRRRFIGAERDEDTNLVMTGPRMYDPVVARFLQPDPAAVGQFPSSPYAYARARPLRLIDPSGYEPVPGDTEPVEEKPLEPVSISSMLFTTWGQTRHGSLMGMGQQYLASTRLMRWFADTAPMRAIAESPITPYVEDVFFFRGAMSPMMPRPTPRLFSYTQRAGQVGDVFETGAAGRAWATVHPPGGSLPFGVDRGWWSGTDLRSTLIRAYRTGSTRPFQGYMEFGDAAAGSFQPVTAFGPARGWKRLGGQYFTPNPGNLNLVTGEILPPTNWQLARYYADVGVAYSLDGASATLGFGWWSAKTLPDPEP